MAVPFPRNRQTVFTKFLYFFGKAFAYGVLGALIGVLGLKAIWGEAQQYLSIIAGVLVILFAVFPLIQPKIKSFPLRNQFQSIFKEIKENPKWYYFLQLGFINGLLPCGMVYMALAAALASGNPLNGFVAMLFFGAGTTPILWMVAATKNKIRGNLKNKLKPITIGLSVFVGLLLILRGMDLGIPYVSPKMDTSQSMEEMHHHH